MKKMILAAVIAVAATLSIRSAQAGEFGVSLGTTLSFPLPHVTVALSGPTYYAPQPVVCAPAPVFYAAPRPVFYGGPRFAYRDNDHRDFRGDYRHDRDGFHGDRDGRNDHRR